MPQSPEWYQQGSWPLFGALATLVVTNVVAIWKIFAQSKATFRLETKLRTAEFISTQLSDFYNPLYALLLTNGRIFSQLGPKSFPDDPIFRDAAGEIWTELRRQVILPNNREIREILRSRTHLLAPNDSLPRYMDLFTHISMYEIFQERPTDIYAKFKFPRDILRHVEVMREKLIGERDSLLRTGK